MHQLRKITLSLLNLEKGSFTPLAATHEFPFHTVSSQGNTEGPATTPRRGAPLSPLQLEMRVPFLVYSERIPGLPVRISEEGALNKKVKRSHQESCHHSKRHPISQSTSDEPDFPALSRCCHSVSHHGGTCDSPVTHPSRESHRSCVDGSLTLLLPPGRKADVHVFTREEA